MALNDDLTRFGRKRAGVALLGLLLVSCGLQGAEPGVDSKIRGQWVGEGWFLDVKLDREYGRFPLVITIHPDNTVDGNVGAARVMEGVVRERTSDFVVQGRLTGPVFEQGSLPAEDKDCLIILIELDENGSFKDGNIHLKTNFRFDLTMRVGGLTLARSP